MVNALRGEISASLDGKNWTLCLTLGALASLENDLKVENLNELSVKFSQGTLSASDVLNIIKAGFQGGGYTLSHEEIADMRADGGVSGYVEIAARLLEASFSPSQNA